MFLFQDLFFKYPHNNFLHTQVEQSIQCILKNSKSPSPIISPESEEKPDISKESIESLSGILKQLIIDKNLLKKIVDYVGDPYVPGVKSETPRPSFIGHLINIANHITANSEIPSLKSIINSLDKDVLKTWDEFVKGPFITARLLLGSPLVQVTTDSESGLEEKVKFSFEKLYILIFSHTFSVHFKGLHGVSNSRDD